MKVSFQKRSLTRRELLAIGIAGGSAWAAGLPENTSWSATGSGERPLRFVFLTDVHARPDLGAPQAVARAAEAINAQQVDFVIVGGDLIDTGFESSLEDAEVQWDLYFSMHNRIRFPLYPAVGNRDLVGVRPPDGSSSVKNPRAPFLEKLGLERTFYSFEALGIHFFVLDSVHLVGGEEGYEGRIGQSQLQWLREALAGLTPETPLVLVSHIPLLTSMFQATVGATAPASASRVVANNRQVLDLFQNYNLILVLQGHLHVDEMIRWQTTTFLTGGAICGNWWKGTRFGTPEGFGLVTIAQDQVGWQYLDYGWHARKSKPKR